MPKLSEIYLLATHSTLLRYVRIAVSSLRDLPSCDFPGWKAFTTITNETPAIKEFVAGLTVGNGNFLILRYVGLRRQDQLFNFCVVTVCAQWEASVVEP